MSTPVLTAQQQIELEKIKKAEQQKQEASKLALEKRQEEHRALEQQLLQQSYTSNDPTRPLTSPSANELLDITIRALNIYDQLVPDSIVIAPGRSPILHGLILKKKGIEVYLFAFSGAPYLKSMPTREQIVGMRHYLQAKGITPETLHKTKTIHFVDYVETGGSIQSLLLFFAHWKYDLTHQSALTAAEWMQIYSKDMDYLSYHKKSKIFSLSIAASNKELLDSIKNIPFKRECPSFNLAAKIYNNYYYSLLPVFNDERWGLPKEVIEFIESNPPKQAKTIEAELYKVLEFVTALENIADLIYGKAVGAQLIRCYEDLYPIKTTPTLAQLQSSFVPAFLVGLVFGYPKYKVHMNNIGNGEQYADLFEFFGGEVVDFNMMNMGLDVTKPIVPNIKQMQETLKDHPKVIQIMTCITKLCSEIEYPVTPTPIPRDDSKQSGAAILVQFGNTVQTGAVANAAANTTTNAATATITATPATTSVPATPLPAVPTQIL